MDILIGTGNKHKVREIREIFNDVLSDFGYTTGEGGTPPLSDDNAEKVCPIRLVAPYEIEGIVPIDPDEDGKTLLENAIIKAQAYANHYNLPAIADDTGLFVDALNGEPGIFAARFAGENCSFEDNIAKLLRVMDGVEEDDRTAHFRTIVALAVPTPDVEAEFDRMLQNLHILNDRLQNLLNQVKKINEVIKNGEDDFGHEEQMLQKANKTLRNINLQVIEGYFHTEGIMEGRIAESKSGTEGFGYDPIFILPDGRTIANIPPDEKNKISHRSMAMREMFKAIFTKI